MPTVDRISTLIEELNEVKRQLRALQSTQRNIDWVALRDSITVVPSAVAGIGFLYIEDDTVKIKFGSGTVQTFGGGAASFLGMSDTPSSYSGQGGKYVRVNSGGTALEFAVAIDTFIGMTDTPSSYSGQEAKLVRVNGAGTALDFLTPPLGDLVGTHGTQTIYTKWIADDSKFVNADNTTKGGRFDFSGIDTATTRTYTFPNASGTILLSGSVAFLGTAQIFTAAQSFGSGINFGTASGAGGTIDSTSHSTKGNIIIQPSGGSVGIRRTSAPSYTLHIGGSGVNPADLAIESNAGRKFLARAGDSSPFTIFGTESNHSFSIITNNAERMRFTSTGLAAFYGTGSAFTPVANLSVQAGTSADYAAIGGALFVSTSVVGNVGAGEDNLITFSVPANTLANNGESIWFEASGKTANNGNAKTLRVRFGTSGTSLILSSSLATSTAHRWILRGRIIRTGAATQVGYAELNSSGGGSLTSASVETGLDQTLSNAISLRITGEATNNNDITCESLIVGWHPTNS